MPVFTSDVQILKTGSCVVEPYAVPSPMFIGLKRQLGIGGGSTVSLVHDAGELLVVDTGFDWESDLSPENREKHVSGLCRTLKQVGLEPGDITRVFITHFHQDHYGGMELFSQARWYCHRQALSDCPDHYKDRFLGLDDDEFITSHTRMVATPGHTRGHASLLWSREGSALRIALCGDAIINLPWLMSNAVWRHNADFWDENAARASVQRLLDAADVIIPGHGEAFFTRPDADAAGYGNTP